MHQVKTPTKPQNVRGEGQEIDSILPKSSQLVGLLEMRAIEKGAAGHWKDES